MGNIEISAFDLCLLIHWARRYCDGRNTGCAHDFNKVYNALVTKHPRLKQFDKQDDTLMGEGLFFPWAQDGDYDDESGTFDARPR